MLRDTAYDEPKVVIIDLGLSQAFSTDATGLCGTPGFIPPETWTDGLWIPKGDIYSMAVVCFQVLTDQSGQGDEPPYCQAGSKTMEELQEKTCSQDFPLDTVMPESAARDALVEWLAACLDKDFNKRPTARHVSELAWFK